MSLLDQLNPPQRIAAEATEGPVVILAGAGSGKTACVTARCAHILETCNVSPLQVCLMTFTNKAANEMRSRIEGLLGKERVKGLWAGTFHSLCGRMLRKHAPLVWRRKDFVIYDDDDQKVLVKQVIEEQIPEDTRDKAKWNPVTVCERIAAKKQEGLAPNDIALDSDDDVTFVEVWKQYERTLIQYNAMDFEDMILLTLELLRRDDEVGEELRTKFRYVMVDEFQDTNKTQWELVRLLGSNRNLCVVGDDDQCAKIGSMVLVAGNWVPIETLDAGASIASWSATDHAFLHRGAVSKMSVRPYDGPMYDVYADGHGLSVTSEHRFVVLDTHGCTGALPRLVQAWELEASDMQLPVLVGPTSVAWRPISAVCRRHYEGPVCSLGVCPEPYFVANGIVTHNSIYGWRGADVKIIRGFKEAYPDAVVVKLEQNYRSTKRIVAAAHAVIAKGSDRLDKKLWTTNPEGPKVTVNCALDEYDEAAFVVEQVRRLVKAEHSPEEIVLLYRSHMLSRLFEEELIANHIAFRMVGGHSFFDRKEIKGLLAYLRLVINPESDVDAQRVINLPHRGIGAATIKRLRELAHSRKVGMIGALTVVGQIPEIRPRERESLLGFKAKLDRLRALHDDAPRPSEYLARLIQETGYKKAWLIEEAEQEAAGRKQKAIEAKDRADNCDNLVDAISRYEQQCTDASEAPSVAGYLERVALITKERENSEKEEEKVTLMTVHAAKGTEFGYVFVVGMEEGYFPNKHAIGFAAQEEEERRLAYVAITRAKRQLWCTYASQRTVYGQMEGRDPSRYIADLNDAGDACVELSTGEYRELQRQALGEGTLQ